ncbi:protein of unknown function [Paraburkholderia kururiensis]
MSGCGTPLDATCDFHAEDLPKSLIAGGGAPACPAGPIKGNRVAAVLAYGSLRAQNAPGGREISARCRAQL